MMPTGIHQQRLGMCAKPAYASRKPTLLDAHETLMTTSCLVHPPIYLLCFFSASRITFFTIFCSSIRKARTTRSLVQLAQRLPPYERETVFLGRETVAYSRGRRAGIYRTSRIYQYADSWRRREVLEGG